MAISKFVIFLSMAIYCHLVLAWPCLSAVPDIEVFKQGKVSTFSTKGHEKSHGIDITMKYPSTWMAKEGDRPHVLQKFVSENGRGTTLAVIGVQSIPNSTGADFTEVEIKEYFESDDLKDILPEAAILTKKTVTRLEGLPAVMLESYMKQERLGVSVTLHTMTVIFFWHQELVQITFSTGTSGDDVDKSARAYAECRPLFMSMAFSVVLNNKWLPEKK